MQENDTQAPSRVDLCLKKLKASRTEADIACMPDHLLKSLLDMCTSEELLKIDMNNDIYSLTDPVWKRLYEQQFGSNETELVHQHLGMYETTPFKWSECFHEKLCCEGVYNKFPFAPMALNVRRRTKLVTDVYTPYQEVHDYPPPKPTPASTSQPNFNNEKKVAVYNLTTSDGRARKLFVEEARRMKQIEFFIICPVSQDHAFIDRVVESSTSSITHVSTLPEGRLYRISSTEVFDLKSPATEALMKLYEGFITPTQLGHEIRLVVKEQTRDLKLWATVHGAELFVKDNGDTVVKISGRISEVTKWFKRLVFLLRRGFFIAPASDADTDPYTDAEDKNEDT